jgi:mono/diheme cytochrome c family protein
MRNPNIHLVIALLGLPLAVLAQSPESWPPRLLRDTGLYQDWNAKTVAPETLQFSPQYPLWTDGAIKTRWMQLPAGTRIDASDPDVWKFPVGTRFWKEFKFARRAETRFIEHTAEGWKYATYAWTDDESEATLAPDRGIFSNVVVRGTVRHALPSRPDCRACHEAGPSRILGFSALQLSVDRDPNAPHAEPLPRDAVTLRTLIDRGLLRGLPPHLAGGAPRIAAKTPTARAALGYLHSNCGNCHTASGELANLALSLDYPLAAPPGGHPPAILTTVGRASKFVPSTWDGPAERVRTGDPDRSVLLARLASRNPVAQMPPLGSRLVDEEAVALIRKWIAEERGAQTIAHTPMEGRQ